MTAFVLLLAVALWNARETPKTTIGATPPSLDESTATPSAPISRTPQAAPVKTPSPRTGGAPDMAGLFGTGEQFTPVRHRVLLEAGAEAGLRGVGWKMPRAVGPVRGIDKSPGRSWRYSGKAVGNPKYAAVYTFTHQGTGTVWCRITVDGKVTDYQEAKSPWGEVYCLG